MLALGDIHDSAHEFHKLAGPPKDRVTDCVNVPDPFFRMNDPVVQFEIRLVADGFLEPFPARRLIVRMKSLKEFLESWQRAGGIESQHAVAHLRPVPDITGRGVPRPTAGL